MCQYTLVHCHQQVRVQLVKQAKKEYGIPVTADVSAHHLLLTEGEISQYNTSAKTNPPLREEIDRKALIEGIKSGIDACNSSHEPYSEHLKDVEFDLAPKGATGLETALLTFIEAVEERRSISIGCRENVLQTTPYTGIKSTIFSRWV